MKLLFFILIIVVFLFSLYCCTKKESTSDPEIQLDQHDWALKDYNSRDVYESLIMAEKNRPQSLVFKDDDWDFDDDGFKNNEDLFPFVQQYPGLKENSNYLKIPLLYDETENSINLDIDFNGIDSESYIWHCGMNNIFNLTSSNIINTISTSDWYKNSNIEYTQNNYNLSLIAPFPDTIDSTFDAEYGDYSFPWPSSNKLPFAKSAISKFIALSNGYSLSTSSVFEFSRIFGLSVPTYGLLDLLHITSYDDRLKKFLQSIFPRTKGVTGTAFNYIHLPFTSVLTTGSLEYDTSDEIWNLRFESLSPDGNPWNLLPAELLLYSTIKGDLNVNINEYSNSILYSTIHNSFINDDTYKYSFQLSGSIHLDDYFDFDNIVFTKVIISKKGSSMDLENCDIEFFPAGSSVQKWSDYYRTNISRYLGYAPSFPSLANAGFVKNSDSISYNINMDITPFAQKIKNYLFATENNSTGKDKIYTIFAFYIPGKNNSSKGIFFCSNVHFWPAGNPTTVIAKVDKNNQILKGPYLIPAEYLIEPEAFINDVLNKRTSYKDLYDILGTWNLSSSGLSWSEKPFFFDAANGEKLLFMQGASYELFGNHPYIPLNDSNIDSPVTVVGENSDDVFNCHVEHANVSSFNSPKLNKFMQKLVLPQAYLISFDSVNDFADDAFVMIKENDFVRRSSISKIPIFLMGGSIVQLDCDVILEEGHWVPNNGELLKGIKINLPLKIISSEYSSENFNVSLMPPVDPNFRVDNADDGDNIYNNKGCGLVFYADFGDYFVELARFSPKPDIEITENEGYNIEYNTDFFDDSGKAVKNGSSLQRSGAAGALRFRYNNDGKTEETVNFAVGVIDKASDGSRQLPRPGDDFLFQFKISDFDKNNIVSSKQEQGDFVAVYDKIMLDRANMFIDERVNHDTGVIDSNVTDWNGDNQIDIQAWTRFEDSNNNSNRVYGAVAYAHCAADSVEHFNQDLLDQLDAIRTIYGLPNSHSFWDQFDEKDADGNITKEFSNPHSEWAQWNGPDGIAGNLDDTIAPGDEWDDNVPTTISSGYLFSLDNPANPLSAELHSIEYDVIEDGVTITKYLYPYKPGYTKGDISQLNVVYAAGIDCSGFIERSAAYTDIENVIDIPIYSKSPYAIGTRLAATGDDVVVNNWQKNASTERLEWVDPPNAWLHMKYHRHPELGAPEFTEFFWNIPDDDKNLIVPGDVLIQPKHIVMILNIEFDDNSRSISKDKVTVIEAAAWDKEWRVMNHNSWEKINNAEKDIKYFSYRLKTVN